MITERDLKWLIQLAQSASDRSHSVLLVAKEMLNEVRSEASDDQQ